MVVIAVGLDLVETDRFRLLYGKLDPDVLDRVFTPREQAFDGTDAERLTRLAARFAVKEAVLKTIGGLQDGISWTDVELLSDGVSTPRVSVTGGARDAAIARGISDWLISLTHGAHSAAAVALATGAAGT
ncbi:holo-ACP synthase [Sphingomonas sp. 22176]|uniref:holo-ACP synthase n=1 Tax=Sphingomonas sp. 22176 TaxID=3453884 RepID=UPI003F8546FF